MIYRRTFLAGAGAALLTTPLAAEAQQPAKVPRIGWLSVNLAASPHVREAFRQGLRDLGYIEGRHVVIEYRDAEGKFERSAEPSGAARLAHAIAVTAREQWARSLPWCGSR